MRSLRGAMLGAAAIAALNACVSTPYSTPAMPVPARYDAGQTAQTPRDALAQDSAHYAPREAREDPWWRGFGDEGLNRLVDDVLASNHDLATAALKIRKARLNAGLATNQMLPRADGSVSANDSRPLSSDGENTRSYGAELNVGFEADLWSRLRAQRDAARWQAEATVEDRDSTALVLVATTCNLYWSLAYLNQRIARGEASLDKVGRTLRLVRAQYRAGAVSALEIKEAEQSLQTQRATQSQLLQQRVETRNAIAELRDGRGWPASDEPIALDQAAPLAIDPGLPSQLLGRRPDLRASEWRLRQALRNVDATRAAYYPSLSLTGSAGGSSASLADVLSNPVGSLAAILRLPFLDWNAMRLNLAVSRTDYEIAVSDFRQTLIGALREVDDALSARERLKEQAIAAETAWRAAQEVERLYAVRYRAGAVSLRVWLDAQEQLRAAEITRGQARANQLQNDVTLAQVLGGSPRMPTPTSVR